MPVIVTVAPPTAALLLAESESRLLVDVDVGLKVAVTPLGRPVAVSETLPV